MSFVVRSGCDISTTCEAFLISIVVAPIRSAMIRSLPVPMALSRSATRYHDGMPAQAGGPDGSPSVASEAGRCDAAMTAVRFRGRSAANTLRNTDGLIDPSRPCVPSGCGYGVMSSVAGPSIAPGAKACSPATVSLSPGAKAAT
jgi:hypothetical protein